MLLCSLLPCQPLQVWYSNYEQADPTLFKKMDPIAVGAVILDLVLILTVPCMLGTNMHAWYSHAYVTQCANTPALLLGLALCPCSSVRRLITNPNGHIPDYFPHFQDGTFTLLVNVGDFYTVTTVTTGTVPLISVSGPNSRLYLQRARAV